MVEFALTAEFHELGMDKPWKRLHGHLQNLASAAELQPRRVLDLGAGSGMGIPAIAKLFPNAQVVALEPDRAMRSMLMGRLASDSALRERATVLSLPIAPGTVDRVTQQIVDSSACEEAAIDLTVAAHMAGILEPVELASLMEIVAKVLSPNGIAIITYSMPHSDTQEHHIPPQHHIEERTVGNHTVRGTYERSEEEFRVTYEQLDASRSPLRYATTARAGSPRTPVDEAGLIDAASRAGLKQNENLSWPGGLVLEKAVAIDSPAAVSASATIDWAAICRKQTDRLRTADPSLGIVLEPDDSPTDLILAEDESGVLGFASLNPPESSTWAAPSTSLRPVVYFGMMSVSEHARRQGVGRQLVAAVHKQAVATGQGAIVLDHASLSPVSTPFWYRHGYRPLWTTWLRLI